MNGQTKIKKVMHSFHEINRGFYSVLNNEIAQLGITVKQLLVLRTLKEEPDISLGELAERLQVGCSTMSGIVDRLVKAGYLFRERSEKDRRSLLIRLTEKGAEKQKECDNIFIEQMSKILDIPDKDLEQLLQLHHLLIEKMKTKGAEVKNDE
ncbi:DNA-binding MarR family transcriptional regulator [Bacillus pakistanensis]|uniref:DNA-binding MarR family transcriptional regulator n=1 Tax=Rossellomorea pakistanensis TaxID=992288 RepID=A0ABS2NBC2_9BACI|nr:MarR family transcriptional regulator [Bacillus pakistanensis]MBM7585133.1 DNA-binding MarR family transcriptional regulator [Bacillus pakistanensis]